MSDGDVKPGDLVGPMRLPASIRMGCDGSTAAPNKGVPHKGPPKKRVRRYDKIPSYYYDF